MTDRNLLKIAWLLVLMTVMLRTVWIKPIQWNTPMREAKMDCEYERSQHKLTGMMTEQFGPKTNVRHFISYTTQYSPTHHCKYTIDGAPVTLPEITEKYLAGIPLKFQYVQACGTDTDEMKIIVLK